MKTYGKRRIRERLTDEQIVEIYRECAELNGSMVARERLRARVILGSMHLVPVIAWRKRGGPLDLQDLIQEGNIGLMQAVSRYDLFSRFAKKRILGAILDALRQNNGVVRVHRHDRALRMRIEKAVTRLQGESDPYVIAEETGIPIPRVVELMSVSPHFLSLDDPEQWTEEVLFPELISRPLKAHLDLRRRTLEEALDLLPAHKASVIRLYMEGVKAVETARKRGVSESSISKIKEDAIARLCASPPVRRLRAQERDYDRICAIS